ncbi:unnamed protein product [Clavelina lepadiformis]|uniref:Uncharacterized protein n=1 Tax=Clavelina lepadiformis TaxID=159417 RepID=A0ABP0FZD3_CLALP
MGSYAQNEKVLTAGGVQVQIPECDNILSNLTSGVWLSRQPIFPSKASADEYKRRVDHARRKLNIEREEFWVMRGFPRNSMSSKFQCGYYRYQRQTPSSLKVGQWCDRRGDRPCCSNMWWGRCTPPSDRTCKCRNCVDSRTFDYAALLEWTPRDCRCVYHRYNSDEACDIIEGSPYNDIYYVGDSFTRDMYLALLMTLTDLSIIGAWRKNMTQEEMTLCSNSAFTNWKTCS